jgi:hypothetical protein
MQGEDEVTEEAEREGGKKMDGVDLNDAEHRGEGLADLGLDLGGGAWLSVGEIHGVGQVPP